jgi:hypothetical protein
MSNGPQPSELSSLYHRRFSARDLETKRAVPVLAERVFQKYLPPDGNGC